VSFFFLPGSKRGGIQRNIEVALITDAGDSVGIGGGKHVVSLYSARDLVLVPLVNVCVRLCVCVRLSLSLCVCVQTYTHTHTHMYMHM
jgi:hypothetical protein